MRIRMIAVMCVLISTVLVLAGCGSSGTNLKVEDKRATQPLIDALIGESNAAKEKLKEIQGDAESPDAAVKALKDQITMLNDRLMKIQNEVEDAEDAEAAVDDLQNQITGLKQRLGLIKDMVDGAESAEDAVNQLKTQRDNYRKMANTEAKPPTADPTAVAVLRAIDSTGRRPGPTASLTLKQIEDAGKATGLAASAKFSKSRTKPPAVTYGGDDNDFIGTTYTRTINSRTDKVTIYTDKQDAGSSSFESFYGGANEDKAAGLDGISAVEITFVDPADPTTAEASAYGTITFDLNVGKIGERFSASNFPRGNDKARQYKVAEGDDDISFSGKFHGISGTYTCTGTCSAQNDENGQLAVLTGTWMFNPTTKFRSDNADGTPNGLGAVTVDGVRPDMDYL